MGQVSTVGDVHTQDFALWGYGGEIDGHVGLGAGVGLDVGMFGPEEFLSPVNGKPLHYVNVFTTSVVALAWIALGVFICKDGALGLEHCRATVVFCGDKLQVGLLSLDFSFNSLPYFKVNLFQGVNFFPFLRYQGRAEALSLQLSVCRDRPLGLSLCLYPFFTL